MLYKSWLYQWIFVFLHKSKDMKFTGIIYCYQSPSGKYYIGQTSCDPEKRKREHKSAAKRGVGYAFHNAIRKYGFGSFRYSELIKVSSNSKDRLNIMLDALEVYYISKYKKLNRSLYNLSEGGDKICDHTGDKLTEEHKRKIGKSLKGMVFTKERCLHISQGRRKSILQYSLDGTLIREWSSASDVPFAKQNAINMCLRGHNKTCAGYLWRYK